MSTPDFCPEQWVWLMAVIIFFGSWLHNIATSRSVMGISNYYQGYRTYYDAFRSRATLILHPMVFSIVWPIVYALLVVAVFVYLYYDDICYATSNVRFHGEPTPEDDDDPDATLPYVQVYTRGVEIATMVLILLLGFLFNLWGRAAALAFAPAESGSRSGVVSLKARRENLQSAATWTSILTFFSMLTTVGVCVLTSIVAHDHPSKNLVYVPVAFGIAALWLGIATAQSLHFSHNIDGLSLS